MPATYLVSDTHFGHAGIVKFTTADGIPIRPWDNVEDMNRDMIQFWNDTVRPNDRVIHLGDVVINRRYLPIVGQLNGKKLLIKGNHDNFRLEEYSQYFTDIKAYHSMAGFLLSHIPVNDNQFERWTGNIHGHMHTHEMEDPRYLNVCVEKTHWRPILFEHVLDRFAKRNII